MNELLPISVLFFLLALCALQTANAGRQVCVPTPPMLTIHNLRDLDLVQRAIRKGKASVPSRLREWRSESAVVSGLTGGIGVAYYGNDGRTDPDESMTANQERNLAATVALVPVTKLCVDGSVWRLRHTETLVRQGECPAERFSDQIGIALCTGVLIGPNLLATADHCLTKNNIDNYRFVFDFRRKCGRTPTTFRMDQVYRQDKIVANRPIDHGDWKVVHLAGAPIRREVPPRRTSGRIGDHDPLYMTGYPLGVPLKYAPGANVRHNEKELFFVANLDGYVVNSGSPVFNASTDELEGIYVSGERDRVDVCKCRQSVRCSDTGCLGESVTRIRKLEFADVPIPPFPFSPEERCPPD